MFVVLRCLADDAAVRELANALESAGFERGDERQSERARSSYRSQPQLHAGLAMIADGEEEALFWERLDLALDRVSRALISARTNGAELELDLNPGVRLEVELPSERLCIDEFVLPHATLARLGRLGIAFRVSMYRSTTSEDLGDEAAG